MWKLLIFTIAIFFSYSCELLSFDIKLHNTAQDVSLRLVWFLNILIISLTTWIHEFAISFIFLISRLNHSCSQGFSLLLIGITNQQKWRIKNLCLPFLQNPFQINHTMSYHLVLEPKPSPPKKIGFIAPLW